MANYNNISASKIFCFINKSKFERSPGPRIETLSRTVKNYDEQVLDCYEQEQEQKL